MYYQASNNKEKLFSVAPMMDWTDRWCRSFHRILSKRALLYTEMVVADAVLRGDRDHLLSFPAVQNPLALQLGGSEPAKLAEAASIAVNYGYDEINLNVGCPSDRVQSGTFGACLMQHPNLVADCVAAMKAAVDVPVTVKCRLGVDDQDTETALDDMANACVAAGVDALWVHARKAWLRGLSPKENRDIPPLDYNRVYRLKQRLPDLFIGINGGIATLEDADLHLKHVDGAMIGRAAYHQPGLLMDVDHRIYCEPKNNTTKHQAVREMYPLIERHLRNAGRLHQITRHMIGVFHGVPGARRYRQILSSDAVRSGAGTDVLEKALQSIPESDGNNANLDPKRVVSTQLSA
ncbi:MAG: tRNA dihydrouridine(20/20a) synthase DusA [Hyphomicrobiales bacterium]